MKVVTYSPHRLVIVERPVALAVVLVIFFVAVTVGFLQQWATLEPWMRALAVFWTFALPLAGHFFTHWVSFAFDRWAGRIEVARRGLFYREYRDLPLAHLNRARMDEGESGDGKTYRLVLEFDEALLNDIDPIERDALERRRSQRARDRGVVDIPFTAYYSGVTHAQDIGRDINAWLREPQTGRLTGPSPSPQPA